MLKKQINDAEIFYKIVGNGDEAMVFLNGIAMTSDNWKEQISFFSEHYKILLHDFRGQLLSGSLPNNFTFQTHVKDIENLVDYTECEKYHLIGMGYGANLALYVGAKKPHLLKTLTLISPYPKIGELHKAILDNWISGAIQGADGYLSSTVPWNLSEEYLEKNKEFLKVQSRLIRQIPPDFFKNFVRLCEAARELGIPDEIGKIKCPTLFISGEKDLMCPPDTITPIKKKIKGSKIAVVKNAAHAVLFEKPEIVNTLISNFILENK